MIKDIEGMAEKLFAISVFDPSYMDAEYVKSQIRKALAALTDEEYEYIMKRMEEKLMEEKQQMSMRLWMVFLICLPTLVSTLMKSQV